MRSEYKVAPATLHGAQYQLYYLVSTCIDIVLSIGFFQVQHPRPTPPNVWLTLIGLPKARSTTSELFSSSAEYPCDTSLLAIAPQYGSLQSRTEAQYEHAPLSSGQCPAAAAFGS